MAFWARGKIVLSCSPLKLGWSGDLLWQMKWEWKWQEWCGRCRAEEWGTSKCGGAVGCSPSRWLSWSSVRLQPSGYEQQKALLEAHWICKEERNFYCVLPLRYWVSLSSHTNPAHSDLYNWPLAFVLKGISDLYSALIWETHFSHSQPRFTLMVHILSGLLKDERKF